MALDAPHVETNNPQVYMKVALAMIVKGTDEEAVKLDRALRFAAPYVDGVFLSVNFPDAPGMEDPRVKPFKLIADKKSRKVKALVLSVWEDDFAKARNANFALVPKEYDYIFWLDADDMLRGGDKLRSLLEETKRDCYSMWYQYDFDEHKNVTVTHQKVRVVKNDGSFHWVGRLHENLTTGRDTGPFEVKGIDVLHMIEKDELPEKGERNLRIALAMRDDSPDEPRSYLNTGRAYLGLSKYAEALVEFEEFLKRSHSEVEQYMARIALAETKHHLGMKFEAVDELRYAIGMKPTFPDAYVKMGALLNGMKRYQDAIVYLGEALQHKPADDVMVAFNPREYDYLPISLLAAAHYELNEIEKSLEYFELCLRIYPKDERLKNTVEKVREVVGNNQTMKNKASILAQLDDKDLKKALDDLDPEERQNPHIMVLANTRFIRETSSGKDVAIYCGYTSFEWNPKIAAEKGVGGSEEAVIELARRWAKNGWRVTVFNNCGHQGYTEPVVRAKGNGRATVEYRPFWEYNYRDRVDVLILWRHPLVAGYGPNAGTVLLDLHDVVSQDEFLEERMAHVDKVFVKTQAHADLFPKIADKLVIVPNGINPADLGGGEPVERDPNLIINTSSPDRSLSALLDIYEKVKAEVPEARLKWAYGWTVFDSVHGENKHYMEWKAKMQARMQELGVEELGRIPTKEVARLYQEGHVFLYPTEFYEIFCISAVKAQAAGCELVTSDFAALKEVVKWGVKIHSGKTQEDWSPPYKFDFAQTDNHDAYALQVVKALRAPAADSAYKLEQLAAAYDWDRVAVEWERYFPSHATLPPGDNELLHTAE